MQRPLILIASLLFLTFDIKAQFRIITATVIDQRLFPFKEIYIQNFDTIMVSSSDSIGQFRISIPIQTRSLTISDIGFEAASINLPDSCNHLDIVLLVRAFYDFHSNKKVDRIRRRDFKKLPDFHLAAYKKGIFKNKRACYTQNFIPFFHRNKSNK